MHEIGRGAPASVAAPVIGTVVRPAPSHGVVKADVGAALVALVDDPSAPVPDVPGDLVAVVCTAGDPAAPLADASRDLGVACVLGARFDGPAPEDGVTVLVDCSGEEGVVRVVDGGERSEWSGVRAEAGLPVPPEGSIDAAVERSTGSVDDRRTR